MLHNIQTTCGQTSDFTKHVTFSLFEPFRACHDFQGFNSMNF